MQVKNIKSIKNIAYIGVGSNLGERYKNILAAEKEINNSIASKVIDISKIYETEPFGYLDQGKFLNCVFQIETSLSPIELLRSLLDIEKILKRKRKIHWGPRTIDLDILFYENMVISLKDLIVPHPGIVKRMFVLKPLCDLIPGYFHPVLNVQCIKIAESLEKDQPSPEEWVPPNKINP